MLNEPNFRWVHKLANPVDDFAFVALNYTIVIAGIIHFDDLFEPAAQSLCYKSSKLLSAHKHNHSHIENSLKMSAYIMSTVSHWKESVNGHELL